MTIRIGTLQTTFTVTTRRVRYRRDRFADRSVDLTCTLMGVLGFATIACAVITVAGA